MIFSVSPNITQHEKVTHNNVKTQKKITSSKKTQIYVKVLIPKVSMFTYKNQYLLEVLMNLVCS